MNDMVLRNSFDARAARARCLRFRRRILDISQQVGALHIGSAYSCTEIVDCIYHGLMRRNPGRQVARHVRHVEGPRLHDPVRDPGGDRRAQPPGSRPLLQAGTVGSAAIPTTAIRASRHRPARWVTGCRWRSAWRWPNAAARPAAIIYVVLSDGEVQEGSTWEAVMMASSLGCSNSSRSSTTTTSRVSGVPPRRIHPSIRWRRSSQAFGWETAEVDGHDSAAVFEAVTSRNGQQAVHGRRQDHQGQGHQLHGERADLALPLAQQEGIRAGGDRAGAARAS